MLRHILKFLFKAEEDYTNDYLAKANSLEDLERRQRNLRFRYNLG